MKMIHCWVIAAAMLATCGPALGDDSGGARVSFKPGSPETLPPDGKSQTVLMVQIDPAAKGWGGPLDVQNGRFSVDVEWYGKGEISPTHIDNARFPVLITVTSWKLPEGVSMQRAALVVTVTYSPPGGAPGRGARACTGRVQVTVAIQQASRPRRHLTGSPL